MLNQCDLENEWMIDSAAGAISWRDAGIHSARDSSPCIMGILKPLSVHRLYTRYCSALWD